MKSILSLAIALVALFTIGTAKAQIVQFTNTCFSGNTISGHIAGLGNNQGITIRVTGEADCSQKNNPDVQHTYFDKSFKLRTDKNGNVQFEEELRACPGGFTTIITSVSNVCVFEGNRAGGTPLAC
ncbi:MAG: hypothetical protein ICV84_09920, partial [Flavisolibacter sp.]|nr:hypothetical protein [Flavisolibacter sp.]